MTTAQTSDDPSGVPYDNSLIRQYIGLIDEHIMRPLETGGVAEHCFAAAMLGFAVIDGLGRLLHPNPQAGVAVRFKWFLQWLGPNYAARQDQLWDLRNSLDHNGINVFCFMSQTADAESQHLEYCDGHLFVHTRELARDLRSAISAVETRLQTDSELFKRAESRLTQDYIVPAGWRRPDVCTTAPADVWFLKQV